MHTRGTFVACLRRNAGSGSTFYKVAKNSHYTNPLGPIPLETTANNYATYFRAWPKHFATYIADGTRKKATIATLHQKYLKNEKLVMITAYDALTAQLADEAGMDYLLIGDSVGNCVLGYDNTTSVTMEEMLHTARAVTRAKVGASGERLRGLVIGDMPFGSYLNENDAVHNACRFLKEGMCDAVKLEGFRPEVVRAITRNQIPVVAHLGLTPQTHMNAGFAYAGQNAAAALQLVKESLDMEKAGACALVLECVPEEIARTVTGQLSIPTIGIGSGRFTSGQVLVSHDVLGLTDKPPKFSKKYCDFAGQMRSAFQLYCEEVRSQSFPALSHSKGMKAKELEAFQQLLQTQGFDDGHSDAGGLHPSEGKLPPPRGASAGFSDGLAVSHRPGKEGMMPAVPSLVQPLKSINDTGAMMQRMMSTGTRASSRANKDGTSAASSGAPRSVAADADGAAQAEYRKLNSDPRLRGRLNSLEERSDLPKVSRALVPTMGGLHSGHLDLARYALRDSEQVVVSIFVNPAQFAAHEDFDRYPRALNSDLEKLQKLVDEPVVVVRTEAELDGLRRGAAGPGGGLPRLVVFWPGVEEMYPGLSGGAGTSTAGPGGCPSVALAGGKVSPIGAQAAQVVKALPEDNARPHFFQGVATVVDKLFRKTKPELAYFGQKDHIQCVLVRHLAELVNASDPSMSLRVVICPTIREEDGLAMSSRNVYLTEKERGQSLVVSKALQAGKAYLEAKIQQGGHTGAGGLGGLGSTVAAPSPHAVAENARAVVQGRLLEVPEVREIEYVSVCSLEEGRELSGDTRMEPPGREDGRLAGGLVISTAIKLGSVRLIDNVVM